MSEIQLYQPTDGFEILQQKSDSYSVKNRLNTFHAWCQEQNLNWMQADLGAYRDMLLEDLSPTSVEAHLSTLRQRIRDTLYDNKFLDFLREGLWQEGDTIADVGAKMQMLQQRIENMVNPRLSSVKVTKKQEFADSEHLWLNGMEDELIAAAALDKPEVLALRDQAIVCLMLDTGIRAQELCNLVVSDLNETYSGHPALRVRHGKGDKQRMVLYGDLTQGKRLSEEWVESMGLQPSFPLFQGFWRGYKKLRGEHLNTWTIWRMITSIDVPSLHGKIATPHDLRRTYARKLYNAPYSMTLEMIKKQMGHESLVVTEAYIGEANVELRLPKQR